jgi:hypothetical protein
MRNETGRVIKDNITLIEYAEPSGSRYFLQCGIAGIFASEEELKSIVDVLNYYYNIEDFAKCKVQIEGEYVAIH